MSLIISRRGAAPNTALADWLARSTAAGVVQAIRFGGSNANVTAYAHQDGNQAKVQWNPSGGIIGDGCLHLDVPSTEQTDSGDWRCPLNASWTGGGGQTQSMGTSPYYVQYRVKLGTNRLTPSVGGGGFKISIKSGYNFASPNSSQSDTGTEIVVGDYNWGSTPIPYYNNPNSGGTQFTDTSGNPNAAPALFTWPYVEQQWFTIYERLQLAVLGGTPATSIANQYDLWMAAAGQTSYTHLFSEFGYPLGTDTETPNGHNGIWFLSYDTGRTSASYNTDQEYDQLIVSTQPIACPLI